MVCKCIFTVTKKLDDKRRAPTGGGRPMPEISASEEVLMAIQPDDPVFEGLPTHMDSMDFTVDPGGLYICNIPSLPYAILELMFVP